MPLSRKRNVQHKVHIPASARENQYLLAKFKITDSLIEKVAGAIDSNQEHAYLDFYNKLSTLFFNINEEFDIESGQFVANDKLARVRFSPEKLTAQTAQQILFLYNSRYHHNQNAYFDASKQARKVHLVFLANGDEIRHNSAKFHQKVVQAISKFAEQIDLPLAAIRISDHQHLTYDLFAKDKGIQGNQVHKLRSISNRYAADDITLPSNSDELTYAIADMPINRRLRKLVALDHSEGGNYSPLYNYIADAFISAAKKHQLKNGAIIANDLVPIVRRSEDENTIAKGELLMLGYNPKNTDGGYICKWAADQLVDNVQFIFVASEQDKTSHGYGKFLIQIENALQSIAQKLNYVQDKEELTVRFHQHIGFYPNA
ncbi:Protein of unknown function [Colwellia chukchiensis]|uniref:DUF3083 family protein n=1 Tax=Colwellia chukchiensis TaxID=641665 RepID=A0A1H7U895_9GAMM|nr:DUF3083 family protein [Colwellia chukchiensis]SEL92507.1 Protein of unknown function [Colwellia chukchiensis]